MPPKPKLELTWPGKDTRPRLEPRVLLEDAGRSYHAPRRVTDADRFDNRLIFGDNLLALKALEQEFSGRIKCICIDPPYNTGSAFEQYDDGLEHSLWLSMMRDRLELLHRLLSEEGSIWITIDDHECHYLKVLCDEVFGRANFVANVVWQKRTSPDARLRLGDAQDSILVYKKVLDPKAEFFNQLPVSEARRKDFSNPDDDPRGPWASVDFTGQTGHATESQFYTIVTPAGVAHPPPPGRCWAIAESNFTALMADNRVWFGKDGRARPRLKRFLAEVDGQNSWTWWPNTEVGHNQEAKKEIIALFGPDAPFTTPKPERLIHRILHIATNPGDWVLDSFAGSGTTGAVAQKMGRRWVMIELGEHCHTHIIPRLRQVIGGEDPGGVTEAVGWRGGGGFRYYRLAPSLLERDGWGRWVINPEYNAPLLAEALCKLEGFRYEPSPEVYWQQGRSTEEDFLYATTQTLSAEQLGQLDEEVGAGRSLLVLCYAFRGEPGDWPHLTVRKIPPHVLDRCEWGRDDYSLAIENLPAAAPRLVQGGLFDDEGDDA